MGLFQKTLNAALGVKPKQQNDLSTGPNFSNPLLPYLYGLKNPMLPQWSDPKIKDEDMYTGFVYAGIRKRAQKSAMIAKNFLDTDANDNAIQQAKALNQDIMHPYLKIIRDSSRFTERQFWSEISTYMDLYGVYYLLAIRNWSQLEDGSLYIGATQGFDLLNPYEIKRVIDRKTGLVAGYTETKSDGRYRDIPVAQIIEFRELNPFDREKRYSIVDASKEGQFILKQSGDYTRHAMEGNLNAPGIINTDVELDDEQFANFIERLRNHTKGEPFYSNGPKGLSYTPTQLDLGQIDLTSVKEVGLEQIISVMGTSKTTIGIESSATNRATSQVQQDNFISDTIIPHVDDIIDVLNQDYKKSYPDLYEKYGYQIIMNSPISADYDSQTLAINLRQLQYTLASSMMGAGIDKNSAVKFAQGDIDLSDVTMDSGLFDPQTSDDPTTQEMGDSTPIDTSDTPSPETPALSSPDITTPPHNSPVNITVKNSLGNDFIKQLKEMADIKGMTNDQFNSLKDKIESTAKLIEEQRDKKDAEATLSDRKIEVNNYINSEAKTEARANEEVITHAHAHNHSHEGPSELVKQFNMLISKDDHKKVMAAKAKFLGQIRGVQKDIINAAAKNIAKNDYTQDDMMTPQQKDQFVQGLSDITAAYWLSITGMAGSTNTDIRNKTYGTNEKFDLNKEITDLAQANGLNVAQSHVNTIINDVVTAGNRAQAQATQQAAANLIQKAASTDPERFSSYFDGNEDLSIDDVMDAIDHTDILDENSRLYEKAQQMIADGYGRDDISSAIQDQYDNISEGRANMIADNETNRAYASSQYQSDKQFFTNVLGSTENLYKQLVSNTGTPCPECAGVIDEGPIPFDDPFSGGDTDFQADGGVIHPNCNCSYDPVDANGNPIDINSIDNNEDDSDTMDDTNLDDGGDNNDGTNADESDDSNDGSSNNSLDSGSKQTETLEPAENAFKDGLGRFTYKWHKAGKDESFRKALRKAPGRDAMLGGVNIHVKQILVSSPTFKKLGVRANIRQNDQRMVKIYETLIKQGKTSKVYMSKDPETGRFEILYGHHIVQAYYNHLKKNKKYNIPVMYSDDYEGMSKVARKVNDEDIISVDQLNHD